MSRTIFGGSSTETRARARPHGQITPIYKIGGGDAAESQIRLACMHALKHPMHDGSEFPPNKVRATCGDNGCLGRCNFYANLRKRSALFGPPDGGERVALSPEWNRL